MTALEYDTGLHQTAAFIERNPSLVVFMRAPVTSTTAGGKRRGTPVELPDQVVRRIPSTRETNEAPTRVTSDGRQIAPQWYLVGMPDVDVEPFDTCVIDGLSLEVVFVNRQPAWRLIAEAVEFDAR